VRQFADDENGDAMASTVALERSAHVHDMRMVEVVFDEGVAVRLYECWCGASDVDAASG